MRDWQTVKLGDVCNLATGGTPPSSDPENYRGGAIPWLVSGDVHRKEITECAARITDAGLANSNARWLPVNSVVIALNGQGKTRGTVAMLRMRATCNQSLVAITPRDPNSLMPEFLFWNLHSRYEEIRRMTGDDGNERRGLNMPLIRGISFPLPPLAEQQRIVAILDEAFEGIDAVAATAKQNLVSLSAIFDRSQSQLFENLPNAHHLTLSEVAKEFGRGKSKHRPRNDPELYGGKFPFIQTGDVRSADHVVTEFSQTYNARGLAQSKLWPAGTLCITIAANIAETAILGFDACFPDSVIGIVVDNEKANTDYVLYCLHHFKKVLLAKGKGSAQDNINLATFESTPFPFPRLDDQLRIAADLKRLAATVGEIERIYIQKLSLLAELKQAVLARAFAGEIAATARPIANDNDFATPEHAANVLAFMHWQHERANRGRFFGHVMGQKTLDLVERVGCVELGRAPYKDAAGPNDRAHMIAAERWAKQQGFFEFVERSGGGYDFKKLSNHGVLLAAAKTALKPVEAQMAQVTDIMVGKDKVEAEVFATVLAAWNNLAADGTEASDAAIIYEARENWHPDKLAIPISKFHSAIQEIRQRGLVPDGTAKVVRHRQASLL